MASLPSPGSASTSRKHTVRKDAASAADAAAVANVVKVTLGLHLHATCTCTACAAARLAETGYHELILRSLHVATIHDGMQHRTCVPTQALSAQKLVVVFHRGMCPKAYP